ncbi:hypothetical protein [Geomonas anaerohicana]|uniref:Uncharacterized protein n=1 Tax=Geomonas anaerohicana TaxID=2798583 RepID=A0ABS0YJZ8_9BACT|nr:hypothetical protein [Geomonas anaerohicana]MBJ6752693.1 hypothetical protein [Geomonas anaerohicana]
MKLRLFLVLFTLVMASKAWSAEIKVTVPWWEDESIVGSIKNGIKQYSAEISPGNKVVYSHFEKDKLLRYDVVIYVSRTSNVETIGGEEKELQHIDYVVLQRGKNYNSEFNEKLVSYGAITPENVEDLGDIIASSMIGKVK